MRLGLERIPADRAHRARGPLAVELHAGLEELLADTQLDSVAVSLERDQMERPVADHGVEAAARGEDDEQLEIGLVVLDDVLPDRSRRGGGRVQPEILRQLVREAVDGRLDERAGALPLAQSVERVVGADDE